jgi:hypothetical protein
MTKLSRWYPTVAMIALNTALAFCVLNLIAYVAARTLRKPAASTNVVGVRHGPARLMRVYPGMDARTIDDLLNETWNRQQVFAPYVQFREAPRRGRFVNVHDAGFRISKDQGPWPPNESALNIFVFGGSTAFSYGLPDSQTVASCLQDTISARLKRTVHVYNFGAGSYQSSQERILFQELLINGFHPDMAIFIDGLNDYAFRHAPNYSEDLRHLMDQHNQQERWPSLLLRAVNHLPAAQLARLIRYRSTEAPDMADNESDNGQILDSVAMRYLSNKKLVEAIAKEFGVETVFIWQPVPFYKYNRPPDDVFPDVTGTNRYARAGYEHLRRTVENEESDRRFLWCADMQDGLTGPLYVDSVHYSAAMSDLLAKHIVKLLVERRLLAAL